MILTVYYYREEAMMNKAVSVQTVEERMHLNGEKALEALKRK